MLSDLPAVIREYLDEDGEASTAEWLAFFQRIGTKGHFYLERCDEILNRETLHAKVGGSYFPPTLRTTQYGRPRPAAPFCTP
jgi:hypothetical protein